MWSASDSRGEPCGRGDHGRTGGWTAKVNSRTLSAGRSGSPPADRNARQQEHESWAHPVHEDQWILPTVSIPLIPVRECHRPIRRVHRRWQGRLLRVSSSCLSAHAGLCARAQRACCPIHRIRHPCRGRGLRMRRPGGDRGLPHEVWRPASGLGWLFPWACGAALVAAGLRRRLGRGSENPLRHSPRRRMP